MGYREPNPQTTLEAKIIKEVARRVSELEVRLIQKFKKLLTESLLEARQIRETGSSRQQAIRKVKKVDAFANWLLKHITNTNNAGNVFKNTTTDEIKREAEQSLEIEQGTQNDNTDVCLFQNKAAKELGIDIENSGWRITAKKVRGNIILEKIRELYERSKVT